MIGGEIKSRRAQPSDRFVFVISLGVVLVAASAQAAAVDVFPGPGTPLQSAINGAVDGSTLRLHTGIFTEAANINKPLKVITAGDGPVTIDAGCAAPTTIDITADGVTIKGRTSSSGRLTVTGATAQLVRVAQRTKIKLSDIAGNNGSTTVDICPEFDSAGSAFVIDQSSNVTLKGLVAFGGSVGIEFSAIPLGGKVTLKKFGVSSLGDGIRIENSGSGATLGRGGILIAGDPNSGVDGSNSGMRVVNSDGVLVKNINTIAGDNANSPGLVLGLELG